MAVAAVTLVVGVPGLEAFLLDARQAASVEAFVAAVALARSEAAKTGHEVVLCPSSDGLVCLESTSYQDGWIVFVNNDRELPPRRGPGEPLLWADRPAMSGSILANRQAFEFRPFLRRSTNGTVTFCDRRAEPHARAVIVSYTGRPRLADSRQATLECGA